MSMWRDDMELRGYDDWKTRDDFYGDDDEREECDHNDYDVDILEGRATCNMCFHRWHVTEEEIAREIERQREYDEWQRKQERREYWRRLTYPIRWPIYRLLNRVWPRRSLAVLTDDEIPF